MRRRSSLRQGAGHRSFSAELKQLPQFADHLLVTAFLEAARHAAVQVTFEERRLERLEGTLDGERLAQDVDTVLVVLDHFADALEVAVDGRQSVQDLLLFGLHCRYLPPPGGGGRRVLYTT